MIRSFGSKETERLWSRERAPSLDPRIHVVALRKLRQVGSAETLDDLRVPPGNRLEALKGDRAGQQVAATHRGSLVRGRGWDPGATAGFMTRAIGGASPVRRAAADAAAG